MKKIIILGVIALILLFTASTAMADTIVWQIGVFDYLYGVTDGTKITTPPDRSVAPTGTPTVDYTDVSKFYSVLVPTTTITGTFTADLSKGAVLLISWSPGASGSEKFSVTLDGTTKSSRTVTGSTCTSAPADGTCGRVPSYYSNYPGLPYYTEIFDFGPLGTEIEEHTLSINYSQGNGIGFDYLELTTPAPLECITPPADMVSWWSGDENADDIQNENNGTFMYDASAGAAGKVNGAFSFDGVNDYVEIPDSDSLDTGTQFTVDAWFNTDDVDKVDPGTGSKTQTIVMYGFDPADGKNNPLHIRDGKLFLAIRGYGPGFEDLVGITSVNSNTWYHAAVTYDGTTAKIYLNGALEDSKVSSMNMNTNSRVTIGRYQNPLNLGTYFHFDGLIDEVEIFNRALSFAEIRTIYLAGSAGKCKVIEVEIDIKPGSDPNSINLGDYGLLPVAILGSPEFDVATIDPTTIEIGGVTLAARGSEKRPKLAYSFEDANGDGYIDMMTFFDVQGLVEVGVLNNTTIALEITGNLYNVYDGTPIKGTDSVNIVH
jgi:hypothetical protein